MNYRPEIDGLRALAVLPVILFHAGFAGFSGGFVGVDIFFVISGYLITSIIYADLVKKRFSLNHFYERRARRILPALYLVTFCCLPVAWLTLGPKQMKDFCESLIGVATFSSNFTFKDQSDYFATASELKPLLHTWSLAVEEQFYLLFPLLLILVKRLRTKAILGVLGGVFLISLSLALTEVDRDPDSAFFMLHTRAWELLVGSLLALSLPGLKPLQSKPRISEGLGWLGLVFIAASVVLFDQATKTPGLPMLLPTLGAALIIGFSSPSTKVGRLLSLKPMVWVGLISYSAYLWHQPLFAFARIVLEEPALWVFAALSALTLVLAQLTRTFIETPCRSPHVPGRDLVIGCFVLALLLVSFGLVGKKQDGYTGRLRELKPIMAELHMPRNTNGWCFYDINSRKQDLEVGAKGLQCSLGALGDARILSIYPTASSAHSAISKQTASPAKHGLLFGDSFAGHLEPMWDISAHKSGLSLHSVTSNWCYPSLSTQFTGPLTSKSYQQCLYNRDYLKDNLTSYDFYVLAGNWGDVLDQGQLNGVFELIERLGESSKPVVIMPTPKQFDSNVLQAYQQSLMLDRNFTAPTSPQKDVISQQANQKLSVFTKRFDNVSFIPRDQLYQVQGKPSDLTPSGVPYSFEGTHLSIYGSKSAAPNLMQAPAFKKLLSELDQSSSEPQQSERNQ